MAVQEQTPLQEYTANGITKQFDLEFDCESADHLIVSIDDLEVLHTDWYLSGNSIVFHVAPASGKQVKIQRNTPFNRLADYQSYNNSFRPPAINKDFDRIWWKLQELGVADWILSNRISALKAYVDDRDDELRAYLMEEIRKQGVALDQLDEYYNYLMERLAQIAVDKGWDASFVVDESGQNQQQINNNHRIAKTIADMLAIQKPQSGQVVSVLGYFAPENFALAKPYKGGGIFIYDSAKNSINDGGVIINGWVRQDTTNLNAYDFGAYGNWNATDQTGSDDSEAFLRYAAWLNATQPNPRRGGTKIMRVLAGSYRLDGFTITQVNAYWSFNLIGEGQLSQLWFNPTGQGITLEQENSVFKNITLHGKLDAGNVVQPIDYVVRAKLANKLLDVDLVCEDVHVFNVKTFARISGRGFTFRNGGCGASNWGGALCEIACDVDLNPFGSMPSIHSLETSMRHFKVDGTRFDGVTKIFEITGTHALKDYINGLSILNSDIVAVRQLIYSEDCTLVKPVFANNTALGCFDSSLSAGAIQVPRAKDVKDIGNSWCNYINEGNTADTRKKGISFIHRYTDIDGLRMIGTTAKDIVFAVVKTTGVTKDITIDDSVFDGFGDFQNNAAIIESDLKPSSVLITKNTIKSKTIKTRRWLSFNVSGSSDIIIDGNTRDTTFPPQAIAYTPSLKLNNSNSATASYIARAGWYKVEGDYIEVSASLSLNDSAAAGAIGISLPVPAVSDFPAISTLQSGSGEVFSLVGLNANGAVLISVSAGSEQTAKLMISPSLQLNMTDKSGGVISIACRFKYRFK